MKDQIAAIVRQTTEALADVGSLQSLDQLRVSVLG